MTTCCIESEPSQFWRSEGEVYKALNGSPCKQGNNLLYEWFPELYYHLFYLLKKLLGSFPSKLGKLKIQCNVLQGNAYLLHSAWMFSLDLNIIYSQSLFAASGFSFDLSFLEKSKTVDVMNCTICHSFIGRRWLVSIPLHRLG